MKDKLRICKQCSIEKSDTEFYFSSKSKRKYQWHDTICKLCRSHNNSLRYLMDDQYRNKILNYHIENKEKRNKQSLERYYKNYEKEKIYRISKRKEKSEYSRLYNSSRKKVDGFFKLKMNLRSVLCYHFKNIANNKKPKTETLLGVEYQIVKQYIENKFLKGMSWDNYGEWTLDHILPLSIAKNDSELIELCHYTNLQPLWKLDNISKNNKIIEHQRKLVL